MAMRNGNRVRKLQDPLVKYPRELHNMPGQCRMIHAQVSFLNNFSTGREKQSRP